MPDHLVFDTPPAIDRFIMISLRSGLRMMRDTGMKPNTQWTSKNMLAKAAIITGKSYKARAYDAAISDLTALLDKQGVS